MLEAVAIINGFAKATLLKKTKNLT
jgi:hypothetical protein